MSDKLAGKVCVVTGAANGIGRASALCLARAGADLAILDREAAALAAVAREIEATGRRALPIVLDCTAEAEVAAVFADPRALPVEDFLDGWFAPEAQTVLHALVARLKSKA